MKVLIGILALLLILATLWETFESIILPRRVTRRFRQTRLFYRVSWTVWLLFNRCLPSKKVRETHLSYYGPLSLLMLFATWAASLILAFAMLHWTAGSAINTAGGPVNFRTDLYLSGTTFFTLGLGDVTPRTMIARLITVTEGGMGFGFLAIVISYLPTMYNAFSQRELNISLLDARAGSPPTAGELLRRNARLHGAASLTRHLRDWEEWCAQLMESHLSYPVLCYFRSQHDNQSWLAAFTAVLDICSLMIAYGEGEAKSQAQLTFAIARHAVADICEVLRIPTPAPAVSRLPPEDFAEVRSLLMESGTCRCTDAGDRKLNDLRSMYEPQLDGLSRRLAMPIPSWGVGASYARPKKKTTWDRITSDSAAPVSSVDKESSHL